MADIGPIRSFYQSLVHGSEHSRPYGEPEHYDRREPIGNALARIPEASPQNFARGKRLVIEGRKAIDLDDPQAVRERLAQQEQERQKRASPPDLSAEFAALNGIVDRHRAGNGAGNARSVIRQNGTKYEGRGGGVAPSAGAGRDSEVAAPKFERFPTSADLLNDLMEHGMPVKETAERFKELWDGKAQADAVAFAEGSRLMGQLVDQFDTEQRDLAAKLVAAETRITELAAANEQLKGRLDAIVAQATGEA